MFHDFIFFPNHLYRALLRKQLIPFKPQDKGSVKGQNGGPDQNSSQPKILRFTSLPSSNELKIGQPTLIVQQAVSVPGTQTPAELITNPSSRKRSHLDNVTGRAYKHFYRYDLLQVGI